MNLNIFQITGQHTFMKFLLLIVIFLLGLGPIVNPYLSGLSEVCCPFLWRIFLFDLLLIWAGIGIIVVIVCGIYVAFVFAQRRQTNFTKLTAFFLLGFILSWAFAYRHGVASYSDKRIRSFPIGAQIRLEQAGGASEVRHEVIGLLYTNTELSPPPQLWPPLVNDIGATEVIIDKKTQTVKISISTAALMFAQGHFGFLFQEVPPPSVNHDSFFIGNAGYRIWKLKDGVFFYQEW